MTKSLIAALPIRTDERVPKGIVALVDDAGALHVIVNIDRAKPEWPERWSDPTYLGDGPWGA